MRTLAAVAFCCAILPASSLAAGSSSSGARQTKTHASSVSELTAWQGRILQKAISLVGEPYVWGGTSPNGMDCSGFVWRVYKLTAYAGAPQLAGVLQGRTAGDMSGEIPVSQRISIDNLQPGDVMFFANGNGPTSSPSQIDHTGIYMGKGWLINSSRNGVAIAPLRGDEGSRFAWGRRPLAEAGLH